MHASYWFPPFLFALVAAQSVTDYAPTPNTACPQNAPPLIREFTAQNQSLYSGEIAYIQARESTRIADGWNSWLENGSSIGYNTTGFLGKYPRVGLALSGGGHRAAQYGAGVLNALDIRNVASKEAGTGGLLQVLSYTSALSGGSWLLGSLYSNDWPLLTDLVLGNGKGLSGWLLDLDLFTPGGSDIFNDKNGAFYDNIVASVEAKAAAGFNTSLTDPWSRAVSYHWLNQSQTTRDNFFSNASSHSSDLLWSSIPQTTNFTDRTSPFPLVVVNSRTVGSKDLNVSLDSVVYEFSPFEFGSFDPNLSAMSNLTYAGTVLQNGQPSSDNACVLGFAESGFVIGSSSSLFSSFVDQIRGLSKVLSVLLDKLSRNFGLSANDVAGWPNPFGGIKPATFRDSDDKMLELIDGGSNGENVPLGPLLVKSRNVDVLIVVDSTADTENAWPNGQSLINSAKRGSSVLEISHRPLPPMPATAADFISTGTNMRPTFFGCDPTRGTSEYPLVVYLPNSPPLSGADPVTNTNTFKLQYTIKHTTAILSQIHDNIIGGYLPNSNSPDPNFGRCLQCATVDRARFAVSPVVPRSDICTACFKQYCYDVSNPPSISVLPGRKLAFVDPDPQKSFAERHEAAIIGGAVAGFVVLVCVPVLLCCWLIRRRRRRSSKIIAPIEMDTRGSRRV